MAVLTVTTVVILAALLFSWVQSEDMDEERPIEGIDGSWTLVQSYNWPSFSTETGIMEITVDGQRVEVLDDGYYLGVTYTIVSPYEAVSDDTGYSSQLYIEGDVLFLISVCDDYYFYEGRAETSVTYRMYERSETGGFHGECVDLEGISHTMNLMSMSLDSDMGNGPVETISAEIVIDSTEKHMVNGRIVSDEWEAGFCGFLKTDGTDVNITFALTEHLGTGALVLHRDGTVDLAFHGDYVIMWGSTGDIADDMGACGRHQAGYMGMEMQAVYISFESGLYDISFSDGGYQGVAIPMLGGEYVLSMYRDYTLGVLEWSMSESGVLYISGTTQD